MTPKEKAKELVNQFYDITLNVESDDDINKYTAKQCALIAVDEILDAITFNVYDEDAYNKEDNYWEKVYREIQAL